jgi:hypothetical protein
MFRVVAWLAVTVLVGALAFLVPIDLSVLEQVANGEGYPSTPTEAISEPRASDSVGSLPRSVSRALGEPTPKENTTAIEADDRAASHEQAPAPTIINAGPKAPATLPRFAGSGLYGTSHVNADTSSAPTIAMIRALQRDLARHGCYNGAVDGDWGPASRYAASVFTQAVNAALPADKPDVALLALARRHPGGACTGGRTSDITTAATGAAEVTGANAIGLGRRAAAPGGDVVSAPPLTQAPRIVGSNGRPAIATVTPTNPPEGIASFSRSRMALGLDLPADATFGSQPITQSPSPAGEATEKRSRPARRVERKPRRTQTRRPRRSYGWRRKIYNPINLGGS